MALPVPGQTGPYRMPPWSLLPKPDPASMSSEAALSNVNALRQDQRRTVAERFADQSKFQGDARSLYLHLKHTITTKKHLQP